MRAVWHWRKFPREAVKSSLFKMFKIWPLSQAAWAALALLWAESQMRCPPDVSPSLTYCTSLVEHTEIFCAERNSSKTKTKPKTTVTYSFLFFSEYCINYSQEISGMCRNILLTALRHLTARTQWISWPILVIFDFEISILSQVLSTVFQ